MIRIGRLLACAALGASLAGTSAAEQLNVSRIVAGTNTNVDWAELNNATVGIGSQSDFTLATAFADPDDLLVFDPPPWTSAYAAQPAKPKVSRIAPLKDYSQNGATISYDRHYTSDAIVDMTPASPATKPVTAQMFKSGAAGANVSYRIVVSPTSAQPLDYFAVLSVPQLTGGLQPAYDLCCSGDDNGGTYEYHYPNSASARTAVDLYVDDLPVWSSESAFIYPDLPHPSPFDTLPVAWDKPTTPGTTTLYLGRLAAGTSFAITLVVRAEVHGVGDCGTQNTGFPGSNTYAKHCLDLGQSVALSGGDGGRPVSFALTARTPQ